MVKQKFIEKRKAKGLSQEEVADLLGMEQSTYSRKENGHTAIHPTEWENSQKHLTRPWMRFLNHKTACIS